MQSSYITSAQQAQQLPDLGGVPEIAFVGRSNCGKSTLLNALLGRKNLARASNTPGRTQMVNFFAVEKAATKLILADLPGYGFSAIARDTRRHWQALVSAYLRRPVLREVLFLLDIRRASELGEEDVELLHALSAQRCQICVVLTKADKLAASEGRRIRDGIQQELAILGIKVERIFAVSTLNKKGLEDLQRAVLPELYPPAT